MVLRMSLRMGENLGPERARIGVRLIGEPPQRMTPARRRVHRGARPTACLHGKSEAAREAGVSTGVIDGLVDEGTLTVEAMPPPPPPPPPDPPFAQPEFTRQQRSAVDMLRTLAASGSFHVALLDGVTGSGKTEVYFEAIAETIRRGKQTLILMPEIALTGQFLDRFCAALWRAPDRMAFRADAAHPRAQLGGDLRRQGAGRGRRALGAVHALCRSRAHRRR